MTGFQAYDQWKTASPYDNDPDPIEEAIVWMRERSARYAWERDVISGLWGMMYDDGMIPDKYQELFEKAEKESRDEYYDDLGTADRVLPKPEPPEEA